MEKFYIFLDIDGVMVNWNYLLNLKNKEEIKFLMRKGICPDNLEALNYLLDKVSKDYEPMIVFTSIRRIFDYDELISSFKNSDLHYSGEFLQTKVNKNRVRPLEIKQFISEHNITDNFIVVDDEYLESSFPGKCLKTDIYNYGLTKDLVDKYFDNELSL